MLYATKAIKLSVGGRGGGGGDLNIKKKNKKRQIFIILSIKKPLYSGISPQYKQYIQTNKSETILYPDTLSDNRKYVSGIV